MLAFIKRAYAAIKAAVARFPGGTAALLGIAVALAARFGFNVTPTELASAYAVVAALIGGFIHYTTVPKSRL